MDPELKCVLDLQVFSYSVNRFVVRRMIESNNLPLRDSGLLARLPEKLLLPKGAGLPALEPCGVTLCEATDGGLSFSFLTFPLSLISPPDPAPPSTSLADPALPANTFRTRFLLT
jgi:hypothetical protein